MSTEKNEISPTIYIFIFSALHIKAPHNTCSSSSFRRRLVHCWTPASTSMWAIGQATWRRPASNRAPAIGCSAPTHCASQTDRRASSWASPIGIRQTRRAAIIFRATRVRWCGCTFRGKYKGDRESLRCTLKSINSINNSMFVEIYGYLRDIRKYGIF